MDLFSCRNCIHNPAQGLTLGQGAGFCLQWGSIIEQPGQTTCRYLHRKDLPMFLVQEAVHEHDDELAGNPAMANLETHENIPAKLYDESRWPREERLDLTTRAVADYYALTTAPGTTPVQRARLIPMFAGSTDARRAMAHASLVRRAMRGDLPRYFWFRRVLDLLEELDGDVTIDVRDLVREDGASEQDARIAACWEVGYARLSGFQEYGRHTAIELLQYPMQELGEYVANQDWDGFLAMLRVLKHRWYDRIIAMNLEAEILKWSRAPDEPSSPPDQGVVRLIDEPVHEGQGNKFRRVG